MLSELREEVGDLRDRRRRAGSLVGLIRRRQRELVDGVRGRVVDAGRGLVPHDLDVARVRLQFDAPAPVVRQPQAAGRAGEQRGADVAEERPRREEVVRERDPRGDAGGPRRRQRVVDGVRKRLRRGLRTLARARRDPDHSAARDERHDGGDQDQEAGRRKRTQEPHDQEPSLAKPGRTVKRAGCLSDKAFSSNASRVVSSTTARSSAYLPPDPRLDNGPATSSPPEVEN